MAARPGRSPLRSAQARRLFFIRTQGHTDTAQSTLLPLPKQQSQQPRLCIHNNYCITGSIAAQAGQAPTCNSQN